MAFDPSFFVNPPEHLVCEICACIYDNPVTVCVNGHTYCKSCIQKWKETKRACPTCRDPLSSAWSSHRYFQNEVQALKRRCSFSGCLWIGKFTDVKSHERNCEFILEECPFVNCEYKCPKKDLSAHQSTCAHSQTLEELNQWVQTLSSDDATTKQMKLLEKAARFPCASAQFMLSQMCGGEQAFHWLQQASQHGHSEAQYDLATHYLSRGMDSKKEEAFSLLQSSANKGCVSAQMELVEQIWTSSFPFVTPEQKQEISIRYVEALSNQGKDSAQYIMGLWMEEQKQFSRALQYYQMSADKGYTQAQYRLAQCYRKGEFVETDLEKAVQYFQMAADTNHNDSKDACYELARMYEKGEGVTKDLSRAASLYRRASRCNHTLAHYKMATCLQQGIGVARDMDEALSYYGAASDNGHLGATMMLAHYYRFVRGHNYRTLEYYKRASTAGYLPATIITCLILLRCGSRREGTPFARLASREGSRDGDYMMAYILWNHEDEANETDVFENESMNDEQANQADNTSLPRSARYLLSAANKGHVLAKLRLAEMYRTGTKVPCDMEKAIHYYKEATMSGVKADMFQDDKWGFETYYADLGKDDDGSTMYDEDGKLTVSLKV